MLQPLVEEITVLDLSVLSSSQPWVQAALGLSGLVLLAVLLERLTCLLIGRAVIWMQPLAESGGMARVLLDRAVLRRAALVVPVLVCLAACSSGDGDADPSTETSTATSQTTTTDESTTTTTTSPSSTSSTSRPTSTTSTTASTSAPSSSTATGGDATHVVSLWMDDTWDVETLTDDLCAQGGLTESTFSRQDELFTCGPNAASVKACTFADGGETTCITQPLERKAIRFTSPTVDHWDGQMHPRGGDPIPLYVELAGGITCSVASHDNDQHWDGNFSWYPCSDGSELLTDDVIAATFDSDEATWTVQRSVDKGRPTTTRVATAVFAGTR